MPDLVQDGVGDRKSWKMAIFKKIRKNPEKVKNREKWRFFRDLGKKVAGISGRMQTKSRKVLLGQRDFQKRG